MQTPYAFHLANELTYDDPTGLNFTDDIVAFASDVCPATTPLRTRGIWALGGEPLRQDGPTHGWKLHVSATPTTWREVLTRTLPVIVKHGEPPHKMLRDSRLVRFSVARWWDRSSAGKFMALYLPNVEQLLDLASDLRRATRHLEGPHILTDRPVNNSTSVFYRWGEYVNPKRVRDDGVTDHLIRCGVNAWTDDRRPRFNLPSWVSDIPEFADPDSSEAKEASIASPLGRYEVTECLSQSAVGCVYRGRQRATGRRVILKEVRALTGWDPDGRPATARLERERDVLTRVAELGVAPTVVELFSQWRHLFLVLDEVPGVSLYRWVAANNPLPAGPVSAEEAATYRNRAQRLLTRLDAAIGTLHRAGITHGDLSPDNVLVTDDDRLFLIDFEASGDLDEVSPERLRTPGFTLPARLAAEPRGEGGWAPPRTAAEHDLYARDCLEAMMIAPVNHLLELDPVAFGSRLADSARHLKWPVDRLSERLGLGPAISHPGPPTGAATSGHRTSSDPVSEQCATGALRLADAIESLKRHHGEMYLYPSTPAMFGTNGVGLAHGAAGIVRFRVYLGVDVDGATQDWLRQHVATELLPPGLHVGRAGVAVALAEIGDHAGALSQISRALLDVRTLTAHLAHGAAGVGLAAAYLSRTTHAWWLQQACHDIGEQLVRTARDDGYGLYWPTSRTDAAASIGLPHGSAGPAELFTVLGTLERDPRWWELAWRALQHDLHGCVEAGEALLVPPRHGSSNVEPYYLRGAAGLICAVAGLCARVDNPDATATLHRLVMGCRPTIAVAVTYARGMAGIIDALLDARQVDPRVAEQVDTAIPSLLDAIWASGLERDGHLMLPSEQMARVSCDMHAGMAGVGAVLHRLADRSRSTIDVRSTNSVFASRDSYA